MERHLRVREREATMPNGRGSTTGALGLTGWSDRAMSEQAPSSTSMGESLGGHRGARTPGTAPGVHLPDGLWQEACWGLALIGTILGFVMILTLIVPPAPTVPKEPRATAPIGETAAGRAIDTTTVVPVGGSALGPSGPVTRADVRTRRT
jgi:hypothetical protein